LAELVKQIPWGDDNQKGKSKATAIATALLKEFYLQCPINAA
jgi:hypothetical protein